MTDRTRTYDRLHDVVKDVDRARVLVGFHFRNSDLQGSALGRKVGRYVARQLLPAGQLRQDRPETYTSAWGLCQDLDARSLHARRRTTSGCSSTRPAGGCTTVRRVPHPSRSSGGGPDRPTATLEAAAEARDSAITKGTFQVDARAVPLADIEQVWADATTSTQRIVLTPHSDPPRPEAAVVSVGC